MSAAIIEAARSSLAVVANASLPFDEAFFESAPGVKVIGRMGVGYDNVDLDAAGRRGVRVVNTPLSIIEPVAEHGAVYLLQWACGGGEGVARYRAC